MRATCIGVGNVGRSWAIVFARAGWDVILWDTSAEAIELAWSAIRKALEDQNDPNRESDVDAMMSRVVVAGSLASAVAYADYIQESTSEKVVTKRQIFAAMDRHALPRAIIASSTSAIPGSAFLAEVEGRRRCLVVHPVNPPHLIPLVEICAAPWTDVAIIAQARSIMADIGQAPVILNREIDGFLLNRLQWALLGEALHLVGEGVCSPDDIDRVVTSGLAPRWAFIGPFEVGHLNASQGLQGYFDGLGEAFQRVQDSLRTDYAPDARTVALVHNALARRISVDAIPGRQAWRDRRLMALRRHLAQAESGQGGIDAA